MNKPLISIIVPVYNVEKYIDRCINSIVNQTYNNLEIILVDDGSKDKSRELVDSWALKDTRIKVFHKSNGGLSDARNFGINKANGEYISFVDSDDYVDTLFIDSLYSVIKEFNVKIACIGIVEFNKKYCDVVSDFKIKNTELLNKEEALEYLFLLDKYRDYACNKLYKKTLFDNVAYPVGFNSEDIGTTYLLIDKCEKVAYNSEKMYFYFQRSDSIDHNKDRKYYIDEYAMIKQKYLYIKRRHPNMIVNYTAFFQYCLRDIMFQDRQEIKWAKKELNSIYPIVKKHIMNIYIIKYYALNYMQKIYLSYYLLKFNTKEKQ